MFGIGEAIGGLLGLVGSQRTNEANLQNTRESDARAQINAREQMAFQERMSNTAHQRAMADLKAAGINPILAATNGASTPGGAAGSTTAAAAQDTIAPALNSAMAVKQMGMQIQTQAQDLALKKAQTTNTNVDSAVRAKDIPKSELMNDVYDVLRPAVKAVKGFMGGTSPKIDSTNLNSYKRGMESLSTGAKP